MVVAFWFCVCAYVFGYMFEKLTRLISCYGCGCGQCWWRWWTGLYGWNVRIMIILICFPLGIPVLGRCWSGHGCGCGEVLDLVGCSCGWRWYDVQDYIRSVSFDFPDIFVMFVRMCVCPVYVCPVSLQWRRRINYNPSSYNIIPFLSSTFYKTYMGNAMQQSKYLLQVSPSSNRFR